MTLAMAQEEQLGFALEPGVSIERNAKRRVTHTASNTPYDRNAWDFGHSSTLPRYAKPNSSRPLSAPPERQSSLETWGSRNLATNNFLLASFPHGHGIETNRPCIVRHHQTANIANSINRLRSCSERLNKAIPVQTWCCFGR